MFVGRVGEDDGGGGAGERHAQAHQVAPALALVS